MSDIREDQGARDYTTEEALRTTGGGAQLPSQGSPGDSRRLDRGRLGKLGWFVASVALGLGLWWAYAAFADQDLLPPPRDVLDTAIAGIADGSLLVNIWASLYRVLAGYILGVAVAIPVGFLMGWYWWARGLAEPWIQFFRVIPPLALIPLVIIFMGIGEQAKIFVIFIAAFLATVIATFQGTRNVENTLIDAARVLGARDRSVFVRIVAPASFPQILTGARIALGNAWATVVAAELIASNRGLGYMMKQAALYADVATVIVGVISIGVIGLIMDRTILRIESRLTRWQEKREY